MGRKIPQMLTIKEAAARVHLPVYCIRSLVADNRVPHIKIGVKTLVNLGKLVSFLDGELETPAPPTKTAGKIRDLSLAK